MNCETCRYSGYGWHENECSRPTTECSYQPIEQPKPETKELKKELNNSTDAIRVSPPVLPTYINTHPMQKNIGSTQDCVDRQAVIDVLAAMQGRCTSS